MAPSLFESELFLPVARDRVFRFFADAHNLEEITPDFLRFREVDGGTVVLDRVRYSVPGGWLVDRAFVRREVERIFRFRRRRLEELFAGEGSMGAGPRPP